MMRLKPVEQNAGEMETQPHAGVGFENLHKGLVGPVEGALEDKVEVAHRLVVVDGPEEVNHGRRRKSEK
jgi:hypothetical protein